MRAAGVTFSKFQSKPDSYQLHFTQGNYSKWLPGLMFCHFFSFLECNQQDIKIASAKLFFNLHIYKNKYSIIRHLVKSTDKERLDV